MRFKGKEKKYLKFETQKGIQRGGVGLNSSLKDMKTTIQVDFD